MRHLIDATRQAVEQRNWYAALALALTLPDICARIGYPELRQSSEKRVVAWFDKYFSSIHSSAFISGGDFYALRCAYLHQGEFSLKGQRAKKVLDRIKITVPPLQPGSFHNNRYIDMNAEGVPINQELQLSIDVFCGEICQAVEHWLADITTNERIQNEINNLGRLENPYSF